MIIIVNVKRIGLALCHIFVEPDKKKKKKAMEFLDICPDHSYGRSGHAKRKKNERLNSPKCHITQIKPISNINSFHRGLKVASMKT